MATLRDSVTRENVRDMAKVLQDAVDRHENIDGRLALDNGIIVQTTNGDLPLIGYANEIIISSLADIESMLRNALRDSENAA